MILFEPVHDAYGLRLAVVFGNMAPQGKCPYYAAGRCFHCDIGGGEGREFTAEDNRHRLAELRAAHPCWAEVAHLNVYNSGSVLNPAELEPELLHELLRVFRAEMPGLRAVSLDSREAFVTTERVRACCEALEGVTLRIILGLESASENVRNLVLEKRMSDNAIRRAFAQVASVGMAVGIDCNVVIGGPGTTSQSAVEDAVETGRLAFSLGLAAGLSVDLNLHPYYPSARGRARFPQHGRCSLPIAVRAVEALDALRRSLSPRSQLFLGWQDEGHDQDQHVRALELEIARNAFDRFNRTQDWQALSAV